MPFLGAYLELPKVLKKIKTSVCGTRASQNPTYSIQMKDITHCIKSSNYESARSEKLYHSQARVLTVCMGVVKWYSADFMEELHLFLEHTLRVTSDVTSLEIEFARMLMGLCFLPWLEPFARKSPSGPTKNTLSYAISRTITQKFPKQKWPEKNTPQRASTFGLDGAATGKRDHTFVSRSFYSLLFREYFHVFHEQLLYIAGILEVACSLSFTLGARGATWRSSARHLVQILCAGRACSMFWTSCLLPTAEHVYR